MEHPITLVGGIRIANFSSPHPFLFTSGEELPGCSPEISKSLMLHTTEVEHLNVCGWIDIELRFEMSEIVEDALNALCDQDNVDIVLVPLPVLRAADNSEGMHPSVKEKARVCRVADRVTKALFPDRFCV